MTRGLTGYEPCGVAVSVRVSWKTRHLINILLQRARISASIEYRISRQDQLPGQIPREKGPECGYFAEEEPT